MQDMEKAEQITRLAYEIYHLNQFYQIQKERYFFDYDSVRETLETALQRLEDTLQCERPGGLSKGSSTQIFCGCDDF